MNIVFFITIHSILDPSSTYNLAKTVMKKKGNVATLSDFTLNAACFISPSLYYWYKRD